MSRRKQSGGVPVAFVQDGPVRRTELMPGWRERLYDRIASHALDIAEMFKGGADVVKVTVVVRNPHLNDGDLLLTDDDPKAVIAAIERLASREPVR